VVLARLLLISVVLLVAGGCGGGGSVSQKDVQKQFEAIQSLAAEGALVADGAADGRTTDVFVRVHTGYLDKAARKVEGQLSSARASGAAERDRVRGVRLASSVADELARLGDDPGDRAGARRIEQQLQRDASAAERQAQ
jgi:hypothetical protein